MSENRPDQFVAIPDRPTVLEISTLLALANRQRLQDREARDRVVRRALIDAARR